MLVLLIAFAALVVVSFPRLVQVVRTDRSLSPPRSHIHELDPTTARFTGYLG